MATRITINNLIISPLIIITPSFLFSSKTGSIKAKNITVLLSYPSLFEDTPYIHNREGRVRFERMGISGSALMLCAARLRHIAGTQWGSKLYLNIDLLREHELELKFEIEEAV